MKKIVLLIPVLLLFTWLNAQQFLLHKAFRPVAVAANAVGGSIDFKLDDLDNMYYLTNLASGLYFAGDTLFNYQFLKMDSVGNELWGVSGTGFTKVFIDNDHSVYIYGASVTSDTILYANHHGQNAPLIDPYWPGLNLGSYSCYVLKFDSAGLLQWSKFFSDPCTAYLPNSSSHTLIGCTDKAGNTYIPFNLTPRDTFWVNQVPAFTYNSNIFQLGGTYVLRMRKDGTSDILPHILPGNAQYFDLGYDGELLINTAISDTVTVNNVLFTAPWGVTSAITGTVDSLDSLLTYTGLYQNGPNYTQHTTDYQGNFYEIDPPTGNANLVKYNTSLQFLWGLTWNENAAVGDIAFARDNSAFYISGVGHSSYCAEVTMPDIGYYGFLLKMSPSGRNYYWIIPEGMGDRIRVGNQKRIYVVNEGIDILADTFATHLYGTVTKLQNPTCSNLTSGMCVVEGFGGTPPYTYKWTAQTGLITGPANSDTLLNMSPNNVYDCMLYDAAGDIKKIEALLAYPLPLYTQMFVDASDVGPLLCPQTVRLQTDPYVNVTYQWLLNGSVINGANTYVYNATDSGQYMVEITDSNGCVGQDSVLLKFSRAAQLHLNKTVFCSEDYTADTLTGGQPTYGARMQYTGVGVYGVGPEEYAFCGCGLPPGNYNLYYNYQEINGGCLTSDSVLVQVLTCIYPPFSLTAQAVDTGIIQLQWSDTSVHAGFIIYRSLNGSHFSVLDSTPAYQTTYRDTGLAKGTSYYYYVTAWDSVGESNQSNQVSCTTLTNPPLCSANFQLYPDTIIAHHWYVLNQATGAQPITYNWTWGDSTGTTGAYPSHVYDTAGYYTICLTITDAAQCTSTYCDGPVYLRSNQQSMVTINVVSALPTSAPDYRNAEDVTIYPNPTSQTLFIQFSGVAQSMEVVVKLTDAIGQSVIEKPVVIEPGNFTLQLPVNRLATGIYMLQLQSSKGVITKRVVITR